MKINFASRGGTQNDSDFISGGCAANTSNGARVLQQVPKAEQQTQLTSVRKALVVFSQSP